MSFTRIVPLALAATLGLSVAACDDKKADDKKADKADDKKADKADDKKADKADDKKADKADDKKADDDKEGGW